MFTKFIDRTGLEGFGWSQRASDAYIVIIGILVAQYTLIGQFSLFPIILAPSQVLGERI